MRTFWKMTLAAALFATPAWADSLSRLMAADRAFSKLSVAKGSNTAFLDFMTDDARIYGTGNEPPMNGKREATERFARQGSGNGDPAKNKLSWEPDHAEISKDGQLGYTDGHWLFEGEGAKGEPIRATGHYLTVWRLTGGRWKVAADMGTTDPKPVTK